MKSAFRVGTPTGTAGVQNLYLAALAGHPGVVQNFYLDISFLGRNAAAAASGITFRTGRGGALNVKAAGTASTAAGAFPEQPNGTTGNDDLDNLLNAFFGIGPQIFNVGVGRILFDQYTAVQLRTLLGQLNGGQDLISRNLVDYPIDFPSSAGGAQQYNLGMVIPLSLANMLPGGEVFAQGTDSLRDGQWQINLAGLASFVNVAGATINLTSIVMTLYADYLWEGDGSWVGPTWRATRQALGGNNPLLKPGHYLFIADSSTQTANTIGGAGFNACPVTQYNFHGQYNGDQVTPAALRMDYELKRMRFLGAYDIGERTVPIISVDPADGVRRLPVSKMQQTIDASSGGPANITLMIVEAIEKNPGIVGQVAALKGGGGKVTHITPDIATHGPPGTPVDPMFAPFYPVQSVAGALKGAPVVATPAQATAMTVAKNLTGFSRAAQKRQGK